MVVIYQAYSYYKRLYIGSDFHANFYWTKYVRFYYMQVSTFLSFTNEINS